MFLIIFLILLVLILFILFFFGDVIENSTDLNFNYSNLYYKDDLVFIENIESYVSFKESLVDNLNITDKKEIIFFNNEKKKTDFVIYFLHGFNTTKNEGKSFSIALSNNIKANLLLARQPGSGLHNKENCFNNITFYDYLRDLYNDMLLLKILGNKIILVGSSTGCIYNLLASVLFKNINIYKNIFFSPNFGLHTILNNLVTILSYGYGKTILKLLNNKIKLNNVIIDTRMFIQLIGAIKAFDRFKNLYELDYIIFISENDNMVLNKKVNLFFEQNKSKIKHYYIFKDKTVHPIINSIDNEIFLNKIDSFLKQEKESSLKIFI